MRKAFTSTVALVMMFGPVTTARGELETLLSNGGFATGLRRYQT